MLVLLLAVAGCASPPVTVVDETPTERDAVQVPEPAAESLPAQPKREPRPELRISLAVVGDMMLGTDYPENRLPDDDGAGFLAAVAPILRSADLTIGNLEGVLVDGGEPRKVCRTASACFLFRSPSRYARHFVDAGFDVLSLANNHARDFGEEGRSATMRVLEAEGIAHSAREGDFASLVINDLKVAVLAFAVTQKSNLLHDYDLAAEIVLQHAVTHDIVVVSFHGGAEGNDVTRLPFGEEEYYNEPRGDVVRFARAMVDAGADLVFGHGPHVVRAMERYQDRLIAYSLGNFATYYGISVDGLNGIAPILVATLDGEGRFLEGRLHSTVQIRPAGPQPDSSAAALRLIRDLSVQDFGTPGIAFEDDGR
ncbi:MAG TPA: CapA family protein, partial [Woeseiaceae bacterium]